MKLYIQHGAMQGDKSVKGIEAAYVDGIIYSPRDIRSSRLRDQIEAITKGKNNADQFFDPQYYAGFNVDDPEARLGQLGDSDQYGSYFANRTRRMLEDSLELVSDDIRKCLEFQDGLNLTGIISPNILIGRSFDSIEAAIAKRFIRCAGLVHSKMECPKPLYVTLAVSREALMDKKELFSFLEDITVLDYPPDGFYILVASRNENVRTDIFNADVIAGWLLMNHTLSLNGFKVINGYSDLLTPFLGAGGAMAGATGWWSNLRGFSLNRFLPSGGGRLPVQRYLSTILLNRITFYELDQLRKIYPKILNGLPTDYLYPDGGSEPERPEEVLQSWDAIKALCSKLCCDDVNEALKHCHNAIVKANTAYDIIGSKIRLDPKSNREHLAAISEGLKTFANLAEISDPAENPS